MILLCSLALAADINVGTNDDLGAAIASANTGDRLLLEAGTYTQSAITVSGKNLDIIGAGEGQTTITASSGNHVFSFGSGTFRLSDLTVDGSDARQVLRSNAATLIGRRVTVQNGSLVTGGGAAIYASGSSVIDFQDSTFFDNDTTSGDGGAIYLFLSSGIFERCTFDTNVADGSSIDADGGAIYAVSGGSLTVMDSVFVDNDAEENGGAIAVSGTDTIVERTRFESNFAGFLGAGVWTFNSTVSVSDSWFQANDAGRTGGIYVDGGSVESLGNVFCDNWAFGTGGLGDGAGISFEEDSTGTVAGSIFLYNLSAFDSGAVNSIQSSDVSLVNNAYVGNVNTSGSGSALRSWDDSVNNPNYVAVQSVNDLFMDNTGPRYTVERDSSYGTIDVQYGLFFGNTSALGDIETGVTSSNLLTSDPGLDSTEASDLCDVQWLLPVPSSDLVDAGTGTDAWDGTTADIGAFGGTYPNAYADRDGDTVITLDDCDDTDAGVSPITDDTPGDGTDQNCDGVDDCYEDLDGDGFGTSVEVVGDDLTCADNPGQSDVATDCDDTPGSGASINPNTVWYFDDDGDGLGSDVQTQQSCTDPGADWVDNNTDCNDNDPSIGSTIAFYPDADSDGQGDATAAPDDDNCVAADNSWVANDLDCDDTPGSGASIYDGAPEVVADDIDQDCDGFDDCFEDLDGDGAGTETVVVGDDLTCADNANQSDIDTDCDDTPGSGATIYVGAPETPADGIDQNCDLVDACFEDADEDGFGSTTVLDGTDLTCADNDGLSDVDTDCDDNAPDQFPGQEWFLDGDGDGFGSGTAVVACAPPGQDYVSEGGDCDDNDPSQGALRDWYVDVDSDGYGDDSSNDIVTQCADPGGGRVDVGGDCDDDDDTINPGVTDVPVDGIDQDCDGFEACYEDIDGDGFGSSITVDGPFTCDESGMSDVDGDCDDSPLAGGGINPDAEETCDGVDEDCSGVADDNVANPPVWTEDADGDGFGDEGGSTVAECEAPSGYVEDATDCDDSNDDTYPGATEICDGLDNDCDDDVDEGAAAVDWYPDGDGDGYGDDQATPVSSCAPPDDHVQDDTDCDDGDDSVNPGAAEVPGNDVDEDCDGTAQGPDDTDVPDDSSRGYPDEDPTWVQDSSVSTTDGGCGCATGRHPAGWFALLPLLLVVRRRRGV